MKWFLLVYALAPLYQGALTTSSWPAGNNVAYATQKDCMDAAADRALIESLKGLEIPVAAICVTGNLHGLAGPTPTAPILR